MNDLHPPLTQWKVYLVAAVVFVFFLPTAQATSVIIVRIDSTGAEPTCIMNNLPMSLLQLAQFCTKSVEDFGDVDPLILDPDDKTTMATLSAVLHIMHVSGVKKVYRRTAPDDSLAVFDLKASQPTPGSYTLRKVREADYPRT